jgi:hypothetical protein
MYVLAAQEQGVVAIQGALKKKVTDLDVYLISFRGTNQPQIFFVLDFLFSTFLGVSR